MAQYYQVASLEELHHLYPNLQLENVEGIQCMIQDDQLSDVQGQQIITTVDPQNVQLSQNTVSTQCKLQQSVSGQYIVQQPTQYVIHQIDTNETQAESAQYLQRNNQQIPNQVDSEVQLSNQPGVGCVTSNITQSEPTLKQCVLKSDGSKQFMAQVQPLVQQPIQIQQQIQTVEMGGNILVLQNQDQDLIKREETMNNVQAENQHHIVIHGQQQTKPQLITTQMQQIMTNNCNANQKYSQQKLSTSQESGQLQRAVSTSDQQIFQPFQYYNQVTLIDSFSPSNVTVEHSVTNNSDRQSAVASQGHQQQTPQQQQQNMQLHLKTRKILSPASVTTVLQSPQQIVIPQRFEMSSSTPSNIRFSQCKKKIIQTETDSVTPVYIVQKVDSPLVMRQHQTKVRFQNSFSVGNNTSDKHVHSTVSSPLEVVPKNLVTQVNEEIVLSQNTRQIISREKVQDVKIQNIKLATENSGNILPVKIEVIEDKTCLVHRQLENANRNNISSPVLTKTSTTTTTTTTATATTVNAKIKTSEQQTEPVILGSGKEIESFLFERFGNSAPGQKSSTPQSHIQQILNSNQMTVSRGRGIRGSTPMTGIQLQVSPKGRGVEVQTSPPRHLSVDGTTVIRGARFVRGGMRGSRGGLTYTAVNQRPTPVRLEAPQIIQTVAQNEANHGSKESIEETRVLVFLWNGEKKLIRIPSTQQSIFLGQILQQAGLTVTAPTSIAVEQVVDISTSGQQMSKTPNNHSGTLVKQSHAEQSIFALTSTTGEGTPNTVAIQQQKSCGLTSRLQVSVPKTHSGLPASRFATSGTIQTIVAASNIEITNSQTQTSLNIPQQSVKEEPRFVSGYMAICPFCGIQSLDFNKCIRCRRKLPENVKAKPIFNDLRIKSDKAPAENENGSIEKKAEESEKHSDEDVKDKTFIRINDKKKVRTCVRKKKITDEPTEILILSSDEEEDNKIRKTDLVKPSLTVLKKEPVYIPIEFSDKEITNIMKETSLNEDLMMNTQPGLFTTLQCRTINFGSFKSQPKDRILISNKGIKLVISNVNHETAVIVIPLSDVLKVLLHLGKQLPVIFIYPHPKIGVQIRNILKMDSKLGPYYDPASSSEIHKRITLVLEKFSEETKIILLNMISHEKVEELSEKEANEILQRACLPELQKIGLGKPNDGVRKILVYPPPPEKGGITLNNQDYACLGEDQFLNDVIIDFYLKYLMQKILSVEDRNRTHVFSTFFYKRLTTKPKALRKNDPENDPTLSPAEKRHMRVKGWTKQVNLFEKDFIIVPINEHSHWFLAIICFPGLTGPVRFSDNTPIEPEEIMLKKNTESVQIGNTTITHIIKTDGKTISLELDSSGFDRDEAEGDQDDLHPSSDEDNEQTGEGNGNTTQVEIPLLAPVPHAQDKNDKVKSVKRKVFKEPIKQPCILIFDSLAGASRVRVVATLRDYLKIEYKVKMKKDRDFSKDTIKGAVPRVPQQNNFTDCGLYVLQYVESFFQDPLRDFKLPLKYLQEWFTEEVVSCKRQKLAGLIRSLMEEQGINVEDMDLPVLTFTNGNTAVENQIPMTEEEEVEEEEEDDEEITEEDEEVMKRQVHLSEFDNVEDYEEGLDIGEEEEEEEDLDDDDDEEDEELEMGEIPRRWLTRPGFCQESDSSIGKGECTLIKSHSLVDYDESESEEEGYHQHSSNQLNSSSAIVDMGDVCDSNQASAMALRKSSLSLSDHNEDMESQILCSTRNKTAECKNSTESTDMVISDDENCEMTVHGSDVSFETSSGENSGSTESRSLKVDKTNVPSSLDPIFVESKTMEVTNIIKKLVCEKNITISRREDIVNTNSVKKHLEMKRLKVKDCDNRGEENSESSSSSLLGTSTGAMSDCVIGQPNMTIQKRTFQALKSVRIPKKAERAYLDASGSKRQKVDET